MSFSRPYKPVKKSNRTSDKSQKSISSFFQVSRTTCKGSGKDRTVGLTTPEKVTITRASSFLSKAISSSSGFEEASISDTSFESPEINNFRNPALIRSFRSSLNTPNSSDVIDLTGPEDVETVTQHSISSPTSQIKSQSSLKRGHEDLLDHLEGRARKIPTIQKYSVRGSSQARPDTAIELSEEQKQVIEYVVNDNLNVFYTGSAGTGKSVVLRELVKRLQRKFGHNRVGIAASTGLAACNIGGQTLHKLLSIGLGTGSPLELANKIEKNGAQMRRWQEFKVLIIDEISMVDGKLFTKLDELAKLVRNNRKPFGGIQIVCTGDFFQLPPVNKEGKAEFCFQSPAWKKIVDKTILLTQVFRQKDDNELIDMLNALRYGNLDDEMTSKFYKLSRKVEYNDGLEPTELFPTREEVKRANQARLIQLKTKSVKFTAKDNVGEPYLQKMLDNLMCEKELELKEGAQVMYLKNYNEWIVNGSVGTVMFFMTDSLWNRIKEVYGFISSHDAQIMEELRLLSSRIGCSDWSEEDSSRYDRIPGERKSRFYELCNLAAKETTANLLPVVNFKNTTGLDNFLKVDMEEFSIDSGRIPKGGYGGSTPEKLVRTQLPLLLSWALSIHKAQGQTIDRLRIDLRKIFEKGQVYVALSRATNKNHLEIRNFDPRRIATSTVVKEFYKSLEISTKNKTR